MREQGGRGGPDDGGGEGIVTITDNRSGRVVICNRGEAHVLQSRKKISF